MATFTTNLFKVFFFFFGGGGCVGGGGDFTITAQNPITFVFFLNSSSFSCLTGGEMTLSIEEVNLHAIGTVFPFFLVKGNKGLEKPQKG